MMAFMETIKKESGSRQALGDSHAYYGQDKKIVSRLARHAARMNELVATGLGREDASKQAYTELFKGGKHAR